MKNEPRFWNFEQLKTVILRLLKSSKIRKRQVRFKDNINYIFSDLKKIHTKNADLNARLEGIES